MDFRTRLRERIEFLGLRDKEVADRAGITKRAIDCYVGARACMPSADVAVRLAQVLGVSVEYLVTGKHVPPESDVQEKASRNLLYYFSHLSERDKKLLLELAQGMSETT